MYQGDNIQRDDEVISRISLSKLNVIGVNLGFLSVFSTARHLGMAVVWERSQLAKIQRHIWMQEREAQLCLTLVGKAQTTFRGSERGWKEKKTGAEKVCMGRSLPYMTGQR